MKIITKNVTTNRIGKVVFILITTKITLKVVGYSLSSFNAWIMYKTKLKIFLEMLPIVCSNIQKKESLERRSSKDIKIGTTSTLSVTRSLLSDLLDQEGDSYSNFDY